MKLLKKLIPIATLASTVAIITPAVTGCSAALVESTNFDYTPSSKHAKETIKYSEAEKVKAFKDEWFNDTKRIAEDILYAKTQNYKATKTKLLEYDSNASLTFSAKVKSLKLKGTKTVKVGTSGFERELLGYIVDYETEYTRKYSCVFKDVTIAGVKYNQIKYNAEIHENDITKNGFLYLWSNNTQLSARCALLDEVSDQWEWQDHENGKNRIDWTYSNGVTITDTYSGEANDYYSKQTGLMPAARDWDMFTETQYLITGDEIKTPTGSYYLSDITFNWWE